MLVLRTLALEPMHGWGSHSAFSNCRAVRSWCSRVHFILGPATYAAARMADAEWRVTENNRRARYYVLTTAGRRQLGIERAAWDRTAAAINAVLTGDWSRLPESA